MEGLEETTTDTATEYIFRKRYDNLGRTGFNQKLMNMLQGSGSMWRATKHIWLSWTDAEDPAIVNARKDWRCRSKGIQSVSRRDYPIRTHCECLHSSSKRNRLRLRSFSLGSTKNQENHQTSKMQTADHDRNSFKHKSIKPSSHHLSEYPPG